MMRKPINRSASWDLPLRLSVPSETLTLTTATYILSTLISAVLAAALKSSENVGAPGELSMSP